ncbi:MAG: hypothetical protein SFU84_16135 [Gemmatimonadales bacterium]|nr:hypothetical protein [Gemmatimonadales bacterium]
MIGRLSLVALLVAAPLTAQQGGTAAEIIKQMTPEERAMAQRKLNAAAAVFYNTQLDSAKRNLRAVMMVMRDSMLAVEGEAARLQRSSSPAVTIATVRRLRGACAAAARIAVITQAKIAPLRTSAELGDKVLADYRITLTETSKAMMACERNAATALAPASPSPTRLQAIAEPTVAAALRYDAAADGLLRALDIPYRQRGVPGGL